MSRLFGTDGVRGRAYVDVTPSLARSLAYAAARVLGGRHVVVGRDTRPSGPDLEAAAVAGFVAAGCSVDVLGVVPTGCVAWATTDVGLMISASHNPAYDNGLKLFGPGGTKLPDATEDAIEAALGPVTTLREGRFRDVPSAGYAEHLLGSISVPLAGITVVVDCAHGAASSLAPDVYERAGATVVAINADGDGARINDGCGATDLDGLRAAVVTRGADLGLAHDGDADRCLAVSADGTVVDGDEILALCAVALASTGALRGNAVATTVMANLGFSQAMAAYGIEVVRTPVGDRYVLEAMRARDLALGGEQSGHVVFADHATTGDGLLTGLQVMARMASTGSSLRDLAAVMTKLPQVLVNVAVSDKDAALARAAGAVAAAEAALGSTGRVLLRPSGTEPLVRVMVEAGDEATARALAESIAAATRG